MYLVEVIILDWLFSIILVLPGIAIIIHILMHLCTLIMGMIRLVLILFLILLGKLLLVMLVIWGMIRDILCWLLLLAGIVRVIGSCLLPAVIILIRLGLWYIMVTIISNTNHMTKQWSTPTSQSPSQLPQQVLCYHITHL